VVSSSHSVPVDIRQRNYIGACPFNPEGMVPGGQDHGTLVISALPNNSDARVGTIFRPWGSVIFVVQSGSY
jgi:hypothetical protein